MAASRSPVFKLVGQNAPHLKPVNRFAHLKPSDLDADESESVVALALAVMERKHRRGKSFTSPTDTIAHFRLRLAELDFEVFEIAFLDNRNRIIAIETLFRGTIDGASVHPREVLKDVIHYQAAAVLFIHNHPSGICEPSAADRRITERLREMLKMIDVRVIDHIIVSAEDSYSFAEHGDL
jgi:DNA repair protein RadC